MYHLEFLAIYYSLDYLRIEMTWYVRDNVMLSKMIVYESLRPIQKV